MKFKLKWWVGTDRRVAQTAVVTVDEQDAYLLRSYCYRMAKAGDKSYEYAVRYTRGNKSHPLTHDILAVPAGRVVRFRNGDTTDYRRENLEITTREACLP